MTPRVLLFQRFFGCLYLIAGFGKFVPQAESVEDRLAEAAAANAGGLLEGASNWLYAHHVGVMVFVAAAMVAAGTVMVVNRKLVVASLVGQLVMLCCFVATLHRSAPIVLLSDSIFAAAAIFLLRRHLSSTRTDASEGINAVSS